MKRHFQRAALAALFVYVAAAVPADAPLRSNDPDRLRTEIVESAVGMLGTPYVLGAASSWGVDCSGLVQRVYNSAVGRSIPRTVAQLARYVEMVPADELLPGDLVFFDTTGPFSHVGIYIGDGRVVHAASEYNRNGVIISRFDRPYYRDRFNRAGRFVGEKGVEALSELWDVATSYVGTPYVSGGQSREGADCSGFVCGVYDELFDVEIPRTVKEMAEASEEIPLSELLPGDLLFFDTVGPLTHVGIYLGNNKVAHAASEAIKNGVILSELSAPYYVEHYRASGRVLVKEPIPWFILRTAAAVGLSGMAGLSVESGLAIYYNSRGVVDLGAEAQLNYSASTDEFRIPVSLNILLRRRAWFRIGYRGTAPEHPALVPSFLAVGLDISPIGERSVRFSPSIEVAYAFDSAAAAGYSADPQRFSLSAVSVSIGTSLTGVF